MAKGDSEIYSPWSQAFKEGEYVRERHVQAAALFVCYTVSLSVCVCVQVNSELVVHAERSPGFQFNLREVRKRMVGQETSDLLRSVIKRGIFHF